LSVEQVQKMLVAQLREELKARGASSEGKKPELCVRLTALVQADAATGSADVAGESAAAAIAPEAGIAVEVVETDPSPNADSIDLPADSSVEIPDVQDGEQDTPSEATSLVETVHPSTAQSEESAGQGALAASKEEMPTEAMEEDGATAKVPDAADEFSTCRYVRIDNFQRPLNLKALMQWLQETCQCELNPDAVWMNGIKTHCYVDFPDAPAAQRCVAGVPGLRFPPSSTKSLVAGFTWVSAAEAPQSSEATLKVGQWPAKVSAAPAFITASVSGHSEKVTGKKRALEVVADSTGEAGGSGSAGKSPRLVGNADIFRRAAAGLLFGDRRGAASNDAGAEESAPAVAGLLKRREGMGTGDRARAPAGEAAEAEANVTLEDLFKKTVATPALYWLPAPDHVVQQRLKDKLMKGKREGKSSR